VATYNLNQLHAELTKAGVTVPALGSYTDDSGALVLHTYSDTGAAIPLPKAAAKIVKAHKPTPTQRDALLAIVRASEDPAIQALVRLLGLADAE
jgi:hypothetical protein